MHYPSAWRNMKQSAIFLPKRMVIKSVLLFERHVMLFSFGHGNTTSFTSIKRVPLLPSSVQWVQIPCEGSFICPAWRRSCASCFKEDIKKTLPLSESNIWQWKFSKPSQWTAWFFYGILQCSFPQVQETTVIAVDFYYSCDSSQREKERGPRALEDLSLCE